MNKEPLLGESVKETERKVEKAFQPSRVTQVLILFAVVFIFIVSILHGINREWAWEVAKALITINGLVLGFAILGATALSRGTISKTAYKTLIEETVEEVLEHSKKSEGSLRAISEGKIAGKLVPLFLKPAFRIKLIRNTFEGGIVQVLISVGFSICLFGVSDALMQNRLIEALFLVIYYFAIVFFLFGTHGIIRVTLMLMELSLQSQTLGSVDFMWKMLEKRAKEREKEENEIGKKSG